MYQKFHEFSRRQFHSGLEKGGKDPDILQGKLLNSQYPNIGGENGKEVRDKISIPSFFLRPKFNGLNLVFYDLNLR